jgi:formylglycine-generating enzyme required for sulfatase activity
MNRHTLRAATAALTLTAAAMAQPLSIQTVLVGNPGNAADPLNSGSVPGIGSVGYEYHIGKYEVTNTQYVAFLNAVAATDPFGLYNPYMSNHPSDNAYSGGITRSGSSGSYTYSVKAGYENKPVVWVSYWDAARFANWLGTGYTEGRATPGGALLPGAAYDLNFATNPSFSRGDRLSGAKVFLPSENEWYKAAYHQPSAAGGDSDNYWLYATGSNTQPTSATPGPGVDRANYYYDDSVANGINGGYAVTQSTSYNSAQNYLTDVGVYGSGSESHYGTADQNGNVWEWNDSVVLGFRGVLGGSWIDNEFLLRSSIRYFAEPEFESYFGGFRVASLAPIPEPGTYGAVAGVLALAGALCRRRFGRGTL